jgi:hypothetical protein
LRDQRMSAGAPRTGFRREAVGDPAAENPLKPMASLGHRDSQVSDYA